MHALKTKSILQNLKINKISHNKLRHNLCSICLQYNPQNSYLISYFRSAATIHTFWFSTQVINFT